MTPSDQRMSTIVLSRQREAVSRIKADWRAGKPADAAAAADQVGNDIDIHKSILLDLAYEEYCLRRERGEDLDPQEFAGRFPRIALSLQRQICIHNALSARGVLGDANDLPEWPEVGDEIAGFLLTEELGRGAFGRVFRANEIRLRERQVVVKLAKQGLHEAQVLARVPHAGVVPIYSVGHDEEWDLTVLCMPFISRATLLDVIEIVHADGSFPGNAICMAQAARSVNCEDDTLLPRTEMGTSTTRGTFPDAVTVFGFLAAEALKETHSKGIFHRDLKPSNILVDQFGCPLLIDFNLSSEPFDDVPLGGTLPYMAPEHLTGFLQAINEEDGCSEIGARADVFSLGVCLFELLYGVHPFAPVPMNLPNTELAEYLLERQALGPRRVPLTESLVDPGLRRILSRCLEFDADRRPQTAAELSGMFRRSLTLPNRLKRLARIHPRLRALTRGAVIGAAAVGGLWLATRPTWRERELVSAELAMEQERFSDAVERYTRLLTADTRDVQLHIDRSRALLKLGRYDAALAGFRKAYEIEPTTMLATQIAFCHVQLQHYDVAVNWYQQILTDSPEAAVIHNNLGYAYMRDSLFDNAIEHFTRAITLNPSFGTAYLNRADAQFQRSLSLRQPTPESAITDIGLAIRKLGHTGESAILACRMISHTEIPNLIEFRQYLHFAISGGAGEERLRSITTGTTILSEPEFQKRIATSRQNRGMTRTVRAIPPW